MEGKAIRNWIIEHDDRWLFVVSYIGLSVVLSIWISLFWLVAVVGIHFCLEYYRQLQFFNDKISILAEVFWELKLDFALILFALALALYMDVILGVVGIGSAARLGLLSRMGARLGLRTGVRALPRFAGWQRALRGFLLSMDDVAQVLRAVGRRGRSARTAAVSTLDPGIGLEAMQLQSGLDQAGEVLIAAMKLIVIRAWEAGPVGGCAGIGWQ
jgi:hypothetical protein